MTATLFEVAVLHLAWLMLGDGDETRRQELRYAYCSAVTGWLLLARRREARIVAADVRRWGLAMAAARRLDEPGRLEFVPPRRGSEGLEALTASQHSVVQPNPRGERPKTCLRRRASTVLAQWSVPSPLKGSSLPPQRIGCAANPCSAIQFGRATNSMRLQSCSAAMLCQCRRHEMNMNPALAACSYVRIHYHGQPRARRPTQHAQRRHVPGWPRNPPALACSSSKPAAAWRRRHACAKL